MKPSRKIFDYILLSEMYASTLTEKVSVHLSNGWELKGKTKIKGNKFYQVMVKYE